MQFQVPQFIETEDKIIGPLTLKQFLYVAAAFGILFLLFFIVQLWLWVIFAIIIGFVTVLFIFIKINGQPLEKMAINAFKYYWNPKLYLWQRKKIEEKYKISRTEEEKEEEFAERRGKISIKKSESQLHFGGISNLWEQMLTSRKKLKREKARPERYVVMRKSTGEKVAVKRVDYR